MFPRPLRCHGAAFSPGPRSASRTAHLTPRTSHAAHSTPRTSRCWPGWFAPESVNGLHPSSELHPGCEMGRCESAGGRRETGVICCPKRCIPDPVVPCLSSHPMTCMILINFRAARVLPGMQDPHQRKRQNLSEQ